MFYAKQHHVSDEQLLDDAYCIASFHEDEKVRWQASQLAWSIVDRFIKLEKEKNAKNESSQLQN